MKEALGSLRGIYLLWYPQTTASFDERLEVIDAIRERFSDTSWRLMTSIIPEGHDIASPTSKPEWRPWAPLSGQAFRYSYAELGRQVGSVVDRLLEDAASSASRWRDLVRLIDRVPRDDFDRVADALTQVDFSEAEEDEVLTLWAAIRRQISHHWKFPDADWALPDDKVSRLSQIYLALTPNDPVNSVSWLFSVNLELPVRGLGSLHDAREDEARDQRIAAVQRLAEEGGIELVLRLIEVVETPWLVGEALATAETSIEARDFLGVVLGESEAWRMDAAQGYLRGISTIAGTASIVTLLGDATLWTPAQRAHLYLGRPFALETWEPLSSEPPDVQQSYWSSVWSHGRGQLTEDVVRQAATELLNHAQVVAAIDFMALYRSEFQPDLAFRALTDLADSPPRDPQVWRRIGHDVAALLEGLSGSADVTKDSLARLEWTYLPLLSRLEYSYRPPTLDQALSERPSFFVDVLQTVYRSADTEQQSEPSEDETRRAQQGFELLFKWSVVPGINEAGTSVDEERLKEWISEVQRLANEAGLEEVADVHIGQILAHSPAGSDGTWPHEAVRSTLDERINEAIERGFRTQVYNNRGVTSRALGEGGHQERELARTYEAWAQQLANTSPRTAALLRKIALGYDSEARHEDERAEIERSRWQ